MCRALGKTTWTSHHGVILHFFSVLFTRFHNSWSYFTNVCVEMDHLGLLGCDLCISTRSVLSCSGKIRAIMSVPSWSSFLCSSPWLDSWLQALTICRAGSIILYAVVSFSAFKGREILGVLLCLHLGQRQTNPLLWVCSKALLLDQITAE